MPTSITAANFVLGGQDKRMVHTNAQSARVLDIGTNWTVLRIGTRVALTDTGANMTFPSKFHFGLLASPAAGMVNGSLTNATSHFVGVRDQNLFTRATVPIIKYSAGVQPYVRVGATESSSAGVTRQFSGVPGSVRTAIVVQITKGSPNFTIEHVAAALTTALVDISMASLIEAMGNGGTMTNVATDLSTAIGVVGGYTTHSGVEAVNEAVNGFLNSVEIAWGRIVGMPYWSEVFYAKMA